MAEINVKSPQMKNREVSEYRFIVQATIGGGVTEVNDGPGLTIASTGALTFTISGFEAESGLALDSGRRAGVSIAGIGSLTGLTAVEGSEVYVASSVISGAAGSRIVTVTLASLALALSTTDGFTDAVLDVVLPIKQKDF